MPTDWEPVAPEEWKGYPKRRRCMFSGVDGIVASDGADVTLGDGFTLTKPNESLLSARWKYSMTEKEFAEGASVSRYLVYEHDPTLAPKTYEGIKRIFQCGLM